MKKPDGSVTRVDSRRSQRIEERIYLRSGEQNALMHCHPLVAVLCQQFIMPRSQELAVNCEAP